MAGRPQICLNPECGAKAWRPAKGPCFICGGPTRTDYAKVCRGPIPCAWCGKTITPKNGRIKTCPAPADCSRQLRAKCQRESTARRYAARKAGQLPPPQRKPWDWLRKNVDERGGLPRKILHTLEQQSESGEWPFYDVLAGVRPSIMDECPL